MERPRTRIGAPSVCSRNKAPTRACVNRTSPWFGRRGENSCSLGIGKTALHQPVSQITCGRYGTTRRLSKQDLVDALSRALLMAMSTRPFGAMSRSSLRREHWSNALGRRARCLGVWR